MHGGEGPLIITGEAVVHAHEASSVSAAEMLAIDTGLVCGMLARFVREEITKVGMHTAVLGLSGGIDSAVVAAIAVQALGAENVVAVLMPYRTSSGASVDDAHAVCHNLGLEPHLVDISPQIDAYFDRFPEADRSRRGNKMARERMTVLYDQSWAHRGLVVGTSNKTELLLGYGTIFGDMAHALNPLGDLYKTQVYMLAGALGLPEQIIHKAPSADLWEGQSDEQELGFQYAIVDVLLYSMVDERRSRAELRALGYGDDFLDDIVQRMQRSQYKRRLPLIGKLGARTIDREFRYPRDWGV